MQPVHLRDSLFLQRGLPFFPDLRCGPMFGYKALQDISTETLKTTICIPDLDRVIGCAHVNNYRTKILPNPPLAGACNIHALPGHRLPAFTAWADVL
eukprot:CAMPEP_0179162338 /NCGR_PEP_ID=MMETSP0796-20121207/79521_1 /TAXON_ID=73915 /ORGANISM="Pyrodinium bahamense, Strain pbaha01" /LENGTH=96 /DNA_ID=CAMNT_0020864531 /DNA_START=149 /DNA_END=436 /DNA_ORIENTATION=+